MRTLIPLLLLLTACGQAAPTGAEDTQASPVNALAAEPTPHVYSVSISGDGVAFDLSLRADLGLPTEQNLVLNNQPIAVGETLTYSVTGFSFIGDNGVSQSSVTRKSGLEVGSGGAWLVVVFSVDGVPVDTQQLSTNNTHAVFQNR